MADIISRLKLESGEFDSKIKRAGQELMAYSEHCRKTGLEMGYANRDAKEFAKALGNMQTTSATARGKISELSDAFVNLRVMYMNMTDEEKNNQFGKNLSASLDQLKTRIQEAKTQLDSATSSLNDNGEAGKGTSSVMEILKDKFTVNIDAIKLFNIGLQAAEGALSVAKDAFFASEATVDEWGRVMDSSKSLYEGFLTALNTGDISGYLGRIDEIVTAARKAYDELDRLGTMKTIQAPKMSAQQTENERMRMMIQTGRYIAPVDGRRASMKDGQLLTPDQIRRIEAQLQNGMKTVVSLVGNEVKQTGKAIDALYDRQAKELGLSLSEFRKGTSSMAEFDKRMKGYDDYQKWREQHTTIDMQSGRETVARGNPHEQFAKWGTFRVDGQRYNDLVRLIQQRNQQAAQAYGMQSQAYRTMNRAEGVTVSKLMKGETAGGTTTTPKTEEQQNTARIAELVKQYQDLATAAKTANDVQKVGLTERMTKIQGEITKLQERNTELKKFADEARQVQFPVGSLPQLNEQLKTLQTEQAKALDAKQWQNYQQQIEQTQYQIDALKGKWQEGLEATFKLEDVDVMEELRDIESVTIDPKTLTVTANTADAYNQVQQLLQGVDGKTVTFTVLPQMEMGTSIQNDAGISAYIASIKQQLETADYGTSLYNGLSAQLADMTTLQNLVGESLKAGLGTAMFDTADELGMDFWTRAMEGGVDNIDWQTIVDKINEARKAAGLDTVSLDFESGNISTKERKNGMQESKTVLNAISQLTSGLKNIGIEIPSEIQSVISVMQGVMQVIEAVNTIIGVTQTTALTANTIAMTSLTAALWANTASSWLPFANGGVVHAAGGIVAGNTYSGDQIPAMLNAGEVVLNRAQTGNLASQLQGNGFGNARLIGRLKGRDILISIDRELSATGKGQLATWK